METLAREEEALDPIYTWAAAGEPAHDIEYLSLPKRVELAKSPGMLQKVVGCIISTLLGSIFGSRHARVIGSCVGRLSYPVPSRSKILIPRAICNYCPPAVHAAKFDQERAD